MSQSERDVMKQVDAEILNATPEFLKIVQKYDDLFYNIPIDYFLEI